MPTPLPMRYIGRRSFLLLAALVRPAFILALAALSATPTAAPAASAPGADLGVASGFKILDGTNCGQYMTTQALDNQCDSANANHYIILGWNFNPNACSAPPCARPDGFNIVKATGGARSVFTTQASGPGQTTVFGAILQGSKGDENIGACFSVEPYRGTSDVGQASNEVCIEASAHLSPTRWGTTHSSNYYDGLQCSSPKSNPVGYQLMFMPNGANSGTGIFAGYVSRGDEGCNFYHDFYQGLVYYDLSKFVGRTVKKATLKLDVVTGAHNAGSPVPSPNENGSEQRININCASSIGFPTNANVGSDSAFPPVVAFDSFSSVSPGNGEIDVDITGMVRAWLHPGGINRGLVLTPDAAMKKDSPVFNDVNVECLSQYREPVLDISYQ